MSDFLTVAEVYRMQHILIERYGGVHGIRDKGAFEAAVFRPQTGYYSILHEEAAALMESLGKNHGFIDGNKRIAAFLFVWFLEKNGILYRPDGSKKIADNALVALTLMIAESKPEEKEMMTKVVVSLINTKN